MEERNKLGYPHVGTFTGPGAGRARDKMVHLEPQKPEEEPEKPNLVRGRRAHRTTRVEKAGKTSTVELEPASESAPVTFHAEGALEAAQEPVQRDLSHPPKRYAERTKQRWAGLPQWLRQDMLDREEEIDRALARYVGCARFAAMAESRGTDLGRVLEQVLADPIDAPVVVWAQLGLDAGQLGIQFLEKYHPSVPAELYEAGRRAGFEEGKHAGTIAHFAAQHQDFELYRPSMVAIAATDPNKSIDELYQTAKVIEMQKFQRPQLPRNPVDRSRMAAKATIGSSPRTDRPEPQPESGTVEDDVRRAYERQQKH